MRGDYRHIPLVLSEPVRRANRPTTSGTPSGITVAQEQDAGQEFGSVAFSAATPGNYDVMGDPETTFYDPNGAIDEAFDAEVEALDISVLTTDDEFVNGR